jgi:hypothetical protein
LVKDYGFHAILKDFRTRYPNLSFDSDAPLQIDLEHINHGLNRRHFITVTNPKYNLRYIYECFYSIDNLWHFYNNSGDSIDINKSLREMNKYKKFSERWK